MLIAEKILSELKLIKHLFFLFLLNSFNFQFHTLNKSKLAIDLIGNISFWFEFEGGCG
jgi:hypothetical protein